jgi:hypothetical protein
MILPRLISFCLLIGTANLSWSKSAQKPTNRDLEVASRFAPVFYQALGDKPRNDYITNFDFDGDWRGDNNWNNAANKDLPLKAYIYFSVCETATHFFIHYAVYHPRDYKGGERRGALLSELMQEGAKRGGKYDPTGLADEATLAHENDMEGALVVVEKDGKDLTEARVAFVETLHHNNFNHYRPGDPQEGVLPIKLDGKRPLLYVEPKGHGIESFDGDEKQTAKKTFLLYVYAGRSDNPAQGDFVCSDLEKTPCNKSVGYQLVPLSSLWAKVAAEPNQTYGVVFDYGEIKLMTSLTTGEPKEQTFKVGKVGCAFLGKVGGVNMARPPWGWFDRDEREQKLGLWFFDPATVIKKDFKLDEKFSVVYVRLPFWAKN